MTETAMTAPAFEGTAVPAHRPRERFVAPTGSNAPGTAVPARPAAPADRSGSSRLIG